MAPLVVSFFTKLVIPILAFLVAIQYQGRNPANEQLVVWLIVFSFLYVTSFLITRFYPNKIAFTINILIAMFSAGWFLYGFMFVDPLRGGDIDPVPLGVFRGVLYGYFVGFLVELLYITHCRDNETRPTDDVSKETTKSDSS
jgi:hypothetical protein